MFKSYILTLSNDSDEELQRRVQELSAGLGVINVARGVDGRGLTANYYYDIIVKTFLKHSQILGPAEVGCALSHVRILEEFLASGETIAVIFEDDVIIAEHSAEMLLRALPAVSPSDILIACAQHGLDPGIVRGSPLLDNKDCYEVHEDDRRFVKRTCAYAVGRKAAEHILAVQGEALWQADDFDGLCPHNGRLLFCSAFRHPTSDDASTIEAERQLRRVAPPSLFARLKAELMRTIAARSLPIKRAIRSTFGRYQIIGK